MGSWPLKAAVCAILLWASACQGIATAQPNPADAGTHADTTDPSPLTLDVGEPGPVQAPEPVVEPDEPTIPESVAEDVAVLKGGKLDEVAEVLGVVESQLETPEGVALLKNEAIERRDKAIEGLEGLSEARARLGAVVKDLEAQPASALTTQQMLQSLRVNNHRQRLSHFEAQASDLEGRRVLAVEALAFLEKQAEVALATQERKKRESVEAERRRKEAEEARKEAEKANEALVRVKQEQRLARKAAGGSDVDRQLSELKDEEVQLLEARAEYALRDAFVLRTENKRKGLPSGESLEGQFEAKLKGLRDRQEASDSEVASAAETFFDEMEVCRAQSRLHAWHSFGTYWDRDGRAQEAAEEVGGLKALAEQTKRDYEDAPDDKLSKARFEVATVRLEVKEKLARGLENEARVFQLTWRQDSERLRACKNAQEALIPLLPEARLDKLYSIREQRGFSGVVLEIGDLMAEARLVGLSIVGLDGGDEGIGSLWNWLVWLPQLLLVIAVLVLVFRFVRTNRDRIVDGLRDNLMGSTLLVRQKPFIVKFSEVLRAVLLDLVLFVLWNVGLTFLDPSTSEGSPLVVTARVLVGSVLIYRILMGVIRTLVLPRWYRVQQEKKGDEAEAEQELEEEEGLGVDLFGVELQRAKFIVTTLRFMLLYTLVCQYSLFIIRNTLGEFFLGRWLHVLGYLGYAVVIYVLLSLWKDYIAVQFARLAGERWGRAVSFITIHKDRYYGVFVIFGAFLYVVGREVGRWAKRYIFNLEVTRKAVNFAFRKRIEMENKVEEEVEAQIHGALPDDYAAAFEDRPLDDEVYEMIRADEIKSILKVVARWREKGTDGAVAIIGEFGMGKTTMLNHIVRRLSDGQEVSRAEVEEKVTTASGVFQLIGDLFELEPGMWTATSMAAALRKAPRRIIVLDRCHNLFLRHVGGFEGFETFMQIVALTNDHHAWLTTFNSFAWQYLGRFRDWGEPFRVVKLGALDDDEIRAHIEARSKVTGYEIDFSRLGGQRGEGQELDYVRSAKGYYSLLTEHSKGNPRVAMSYWLRSLRSTTDDKRLEVTLFRVPQTRAISLGTDFRFVLAAIVQHECLDPGELRRIINIDRSFCAMALDQFQEMEVITLEPVTGRARMEPVFYQQILQHLKKVNFLYN